MEINCEDNADALLFLKSFWRRIVFDFCFQDTGRYFVTFSVVLIEVCHFFQLIRKKVKIGEKVWPGRPSSDQTDERCSAAEGNREEQWRGWETLRCSCNFPVEFSCPFEVIFCRYTTCAYYWFQWIESLCWIIRNKRAFTEPHVCRLHRSPMDSHSTSDSAVHVQHH